MPTSLKRAQTNTELPHQIKFEQTVVFDALYIFNLFSSQVLVLIGSDNKQLQINTSELELLKLIKQTWCTLQKGVHMDSNSFLNFLITFFFKKHVQQMQRYSNLKPNIKENIVLNSFQFAKK